MEGKEVLFDCTVRMKKITIGQVMVRTTSA